MEKETQIYEEFEWTDEMKQKMIEEQKEGLIEEETKDFKEFVDNVKITSRTVEPETKLHDWMRFLHDMMYFKPGDEDPESLKDVFARQKIIKEAYDGYKAFLETEEGAKEFWDREQYLQEHPEERPGDNLCITVKVKSIDKPEE